MTFPAIRALAISLLLCLATTSCGGVSHGGGIGGTGLVVGVVTGFGSVIVDGIELDTSLATITVNGEVADPSELRLGMVVTVKGQIDEDNLSGVAESVVFDSLLEGPVEGVFASSGAADVLGDTVLIDDATVLDGIAFDPTSIGTVVVVSGFEDADGIIRATRLAARPDGGNQSFVIDGRVTNLNSSSNRFEIRLSTIDYSTATFTGGTADSLSDGSEVRVRLSSAPQAGVAHADSVKILRRNVSVDQGRNVHLVGVISSRVGPRRFRLNHRHEILVDANTEVLGGNVDQITRNTILAIKGTVQADGSILARRVTIRDVFVLRPGTTPRPMP